MDKNTASKIIKELINTPKHNNSFIIDLDKRKYDLFQVSKNSIKLINKKYNSKEHDNNKKYDDILLESHKELFVDGGNAEIFSSANATLHIIRIYGAVFFLGKKIFSEKSEFFVLSKTSKRDDKLGFTVQIYPLNGNLLINTSSFWILQTDKTINKEKMNGSIEGDYLSEDESEEEDISNINSSTNFLSKTIDIIRKISEVSLASKLISKLGKGDIVILDGTLKATNDIEFEAFENLYVIARKKEVSICSVAKTTKLLTKDGLSLSEAFTHLLDDLTNNSNNDSNKIESNKLQNNPCYALLVSSKSKNHKAQIFAIKLHNKAEHIFRFDINKESANAIDYVLSSLFQNSTDPTFLGYPYGLIHADKFARVTNNEQVFYKTLFKTRAGINWKELSKQEASINAHSILDNM